MSSAGVVDDRHPTAGWAPPNQTECYGDTVRQSRHSMIKGSLSMETHDIG